MASKSSLRSGLIGLLLSSGALLASGVGQQPVYDQEPSHGFAGPSRKRRKHRLDDYEYGTNRAAVSQESLEAIKLARVEAEQQRQAKREAKLARREKQRNQHVKA